MIYYGGLDHSYELIYLNFQIIFKVILHKFFSLPLQYHVWLIRISLNNIIPFISAFPLTFWIQFTSGSVGLNLFLKYVNFIALKVLDYLIIFIITTVNFLQKFVQILIKF